MLQRSDQVSQLDQALRGQPVARRGGRPVGPAHWQRHPSGRAPLADEDKRGPRTAALQDDSEPLTGERVEGVSDEDRVQSRARTGRAGPMRRPWGSTAAWCGLAVLAWG